MGKYPPFNQKMFYLYFDGETPKYIFERSAEILGVVETNFIGYFTDVVSRAQQDCGTLKTHYTDKFLR